jgi:hypothetical protein
MRLRLQSLRGLFHGLCFIAGTVDYASNQSYLGCLTSQMCEAVLI